jgi:hypothetical protein
MPHGLKPQILVVDDFLKAIASLIATKPALDS